MSDPLDCQAVDELDAAMALGAVEADEVRAIAAHLATCAEPHAQLRAFLGANQVLAMDLDPAPPSAGLRDRLMATLERTPQEQRTTGAVVRDRAATRGWLDWLSPRVARPLAVASVIALLVVGAWSVALQSQIGDRDRALRAVATAISRGEVAFRVDGSAGRGYLVDTPGNGAALVIADLAALPANQLYELWLLDAAGAPVAVGTFTPGSEAIAVVPVERDLAGYATFAVTVEPQRLVAPTGDPVMIGHLSTP